MLVRHRFINLSIRWKLSLITTLVSVVSLFLACGAFLAYEMLMFRHTTTEKASALARVVAANCRAALTFDDPQDAADTLESLSAERHIICAALYSQDRQVFATYCRPDRASEAEALIPPAPEPEGMLFRGAHGELFQRVSFHGEELGTVYIRSDLEEMHSRLRRYLGITVLVLLASAAVALVLSTRLQQVISKPLLQLSDTARLVSEQKDYSVRVAPYSRDEIGVLIEGFNEMLAQIQERDAALLESQEELEHRVELRTQELQQEIAERKRAQDEVHQLNAQLEERVAQRTAELEAANKELEAFSYSISHDLNAPLRAMDGYSRIILEEYAGEIPEEGRRYLELVRANANQMGELIHDLLAFSRLSRQPLQKEAVAPRVIVEEVLAELELQRGDRKLVVQVGELPTCRASSALLRQVYANLLGNAFKYTRAREEAVIEIGSQEEDGSTVYYVKDNGVGFDMRYAHKLFGVFQRLHRAEEYEGTGVGLAIVQRIVHRHGGRIWAEAERNRGAAFYFTLEGSKNHV